MQYTQTTSTIEKTILPQPKKDQARSAAYKHWQYRLPAQAEPQPKNQGRAANYSAYP